MGKLITAMTEYWRKRDTTESQDVLNESRVLAYLVKLADKYLDNQNNEYFEIEVSESQLGVVIPALNKSAFSSMYVYDEVETYPDGGVLYRIRKRVIDL